MKILWSRKDENKKVKFKPYSWYLNNLLCYTEKKIEKSFIK